MCAAAYAQSPEIPGDGHAMLRVDVKDNYLLLPVQEDVDNANVTVIASGDSRFACYSTLFKQPNR